MKAGAVAIPLALVDTVGLEPNAPLAPEPGAANVTLTAGTGLFEASRTRACIAVAKAVLTVALCGVPANAVIELADPGLLVKEKLGGEPMPGIDVVTE